MRPFVAWTLAPLFAAGLWGQTVQLKQTATGFTAPTDIQSARDGSGRLFVVEQAGLVRIWKDGQAGTKTFLDISDRTAGGGERGLLGLAFAPNYAQSGVFYVNYTTPGQPFDTIVARYRVSSDPDRADKASEEILLRIRQPYDNHNGGQIAFSPRDGFLYIGMGDGGSGGDPQGNAQNPAVLLGKMLRIDVSAPGAYTIPASNPFGNDARYRPEIWALGVRNPWRFSFDRQTGDLYIADVGQDVLEEIDRQPADSRGGENYGWNQAEGSRCYLPNCDLTRFTAPVWNYDHSGGRCSITGGKLYRGSAYPGLRGLYLFADYCSGTLWALRRDGNTWTAPALLSTGLVITTFGEDEAGEVYLTDSRRGVLYQVTALNRPTVSATGAVNAASFQGAGTPGSLLAIFGTSISSGSGVRSADRIPLPTSLSGVSATLNGMSAPLLAVADTNGQEQINLQVPWELAGASEARLVVTTANGASDPVTIPLAVQPGLFTTDGRTAARSGDARAGQFVTLYGTGFGPVTGAPPTGSAAAANTDQRTTSAVTVTANGQPAAVDYAGLAPGFVGLYQLNVRLPEGLRGDVELIATVSGRASSAVHLTLP